MLHRDVIAKQWKMIDNPFRYCGEYYDQETGSIYLRARYYDPVLGRFTQEDSYKGNIADPLSLNVYSYCENNPVRYIDPSGQYMEGDDDLEMDKKDIARIQEYSDKYKKAKTDADRQYWHDEANRIRLNYINAVTRINYCEW